MYDPVAVLALAVGRSTGTLGLILRIAPILFGCGFLIVGAAQLVTAVRDSMEANNSKRWPTTSGLVLSSSVKTTQSRGGVAYTPKVTYSYTIGTHTYTGDRIWTQEFADHADRAHATSAKYPVGALVTVHYDPSALENSLLEPGIFVFSYIWFGLAIVAIVIGGVSLYLGL